MGVGWEEIYAFGKAQGMNFPPSLFMKQKQKACGGGWAASGSIFLSYYIRRLKIPNIQTSRQAYRMMHDCVQAGTDRTPQGCRRIAPSTATFCVSSHGTSGGYFWGASNGTNCTVPWRAATWHKSRKREGQASWQSLALQNREFW
jgi:hypothetical protein